MARVHSEGGPVGPHELENGVDAPLVRGHCLCQNVTLDLQASVLPAQRNNLLALGEGERFLAGWRLPGTDGGRPNPVAVGRIQLRSNIAVTSNSRAKFARRAPDCSLLDHLLAELRATGSAALPRQGGPLP
ncbi:MAG TPA: hypothetical protein VK047_11995 [Zeimonas sp.]|jgi:hypothetical protein|nr:hypothetical protein [Zeimonas sp.]